MAMTTSTLSDDEYRAVVNCEHCGRPVRVSFLPTHLERGCEPADSRPDWTFEPE